MKNTKWFPFIFVFLFADCLFQTTESKQIDFKPSNKINNDSIVLKSLCDKFNQLNTAIRDFKVEKGIAKQQTKLLLDSIHILFFKKNPMASKSVEIFPLKGYNASVIGGSNGSGYISSGFDFFDGNNRKGHPAHDIFIYDVNQDCIDDKTKLPVAVLSFTDGVVISTETQWATSSDLKGGKYIYIYSPQIQKIFYYAHNNTISVTVGQFVKAGQQISTVGRTGFSAYPKRSPTHLHFMELKLDSNYYPIPINPYTELLKCKSL